MTESRGAMTAQQFWPKYWTGERLMEWLNLHEPERTKALQLGFADALSAHNTAAKEAEWKAILDNACLCEFCAAKFEALSGEKHRAHQIAECREQIAQIQ